MIFDESLHFFSFIKIIKDDLVGIATDLLMVILIHLFFTPQKCSLYKKNSYFASNKLIQLMQPNKQETNVIRQT